MTGIQLAKGDLLEKRLFEMGSEQEYVSHSVLEVMNLRG